MAVLVTGSSGHLGEALMRRLRADGRAARGIDIKPVAVHRPCRFDRRPRFVARCMRGVRTRCIHAATLHKPHVATHPRQDFVDTNITGTLNLLEAARRRARCARSSSPAPPARSATRSCRAAGAPAAWITEDVCRFRRTSTASPSSPPRTSASCSRATSGCRARAAHLALFPRGRRQSRPSRDAYDDANVQANELLYRRVDIEDVVDAHLLALERAAGARLPEIHHLGHDAVQAATISPSSARDAPGGAPAVPGLSCTLRSDAAGGCFPEIDRVYVNAAARARPRLARRATTSAIVLDCLRAGADFRSPLAIAVGSKGYHEQVFDAGPYPVEAR